MRHSDCTTSFCSIVNTAMAIGQSAFFWAIGLVVFCHSCFGAHTALASKGANSPLSAAPFAAPVQSPSTLRLLPAYFSFQHDNDVIVDSDRDYSSGLFVHFGNLGALRNAARALTRLWLPPDLQRRSLSSFGLFLGQEIYTPLDTILEDFLPDERPYAGWLYLGAQYRVVVPRWELRLSLRLGIVGRASLGQDVQQLWHGFLRLLIPTTAKGSGWGYQLPHEFTVQALASWEYYLFQMRHGATQWMTLDVTAEIALGNVFVHPEMRLTWKIGWLPQRTFGAEIPTVWTGREANLVGGAAPLQARVAARSVARSGVVTPRKPVSPGLAAPNKGTSNKGTSRRSWDVQFFVEGFARIVVRNLFLDGSTFVESHRIARYPVVAGVELGLDWRVRTFRMRFGFVIQTLDAPYALRAYQDHKYARLTLSYEAPAE